MTDDRSDVEGHEPQLITGWALARAVTKELEPDSLHDLDLTYSSYEANPRSLRTRRQVGGAADVVVATLVPVIIIGAQYALQVLQDAVTQTATDRLKDKLARLVGQPPPDPAPALPAGDTFSEEHLRAARAVIVDKLTRREGFPADRAEAVANAIIAKLATGAWRDDGPVVHDESSGDDPAE
ncbi:hypothetical protein QCN29_33690 [Streptomyces sp. HNM0663]|uniref:Uncharacterized protein n=1 Tax=Streptomyces chengmaiensis TaxID=3040919 RepID=A0ABT6HY77_9ACTN|nr:hypothetical protein [Streptomyces chengmaiensis]MDH2393630.1 hypothetical protein [Streptomyces chengmaiensis]